METQGIVIIPIDLGLPKMAGLLKSCLFKLNRFHLGDKKIITSCRNHLRPGFKFTVFHNQGIKLSFRYGFEFVF